MAFLSLSINVMAFVGLAVAVGPAAVNLRSAGGFAILAETGVSTVPKSAVTGNIGVSAIATTALTGFSLVADPSGTFWTSTQVSGELMGASDAPPTPGLLTTAISDIETAYTDAMGRSNPDFVEFAAGVLGGLVFVPGLYKWTSTVQIITDITLAGGPSDTWIFQISGTFDQAANTQINLIGGATSKNIIWVIAGATTIGAGAIFEGNILAKTNVVFQTSSVDHGCIYAQTAVTLQQATVLCSSSGATPPTPPVCSPTPSGSFCSTTTFQDLDASVQGDDYLTFTFVDTIDECIGFCACLPGCGFANTYYEVSGTNTSSLQLTCAIYQGCHSAVDATNTGGQSQPDGSLSSIASSDGYCSDIPAITGGTSVDHPVVTFYTTGW
ncbi:hypothetical protein C8J56DRAFT_936614 [Mycena floridula]|nr:hypothetical protein C8J56DRAFT_936614 [Mycena floridula]